MVKARNYSIEVMKFIATLAIFNHLAQPFYGKWTMLATGGVVGCSIFFFCSGFTLTMGNLNDRFDSWYKRRLARLWPTCIAVTCLYGIVGQDYRGGVLFALSGAGWFVTCILIHYAVFYWSNRFWEKRIGLQIIIALSLVLVWWLILLVQKSAIVTSVYGGSYFRWALYYLFFLMGAAVSQNKMTCSKVSRRPMRNMITSLFCMIAFYTINFGIKDHSVWARYQIVSLLPLALFVYYLYVALEGLSRMVTTKVYVIIPVVGSLSLEMYLVGRFGAEFAPLGLGPISYGLGLLLALSLAYVVRTFGRLFAQTISTQREYDWKEIVRL